MVTTPWNDKTLDEKISDVLARSDDFLKRVDGVSNF